MPAWLLIVCAGVGAVLVFSEIVIRMVTTLRVPKPEAKDVTIADLRGRLDAIGSAVEPLKPAWTAASPTPNEVTEMQRALSTVDEHLPSDGKGLVGDSGGWLGSLLSGVTRQNVFLGVGLVLLLIPALIAGGFNVGFDRLSDTPVATPSPAR